MLRNYFATALRNLARNRLTASINIAGLAIGFTAAMLIALYVYDELTFDTWLPGHENVYRVAKEVRFPGVAPQRSDGSGPAEAAWFASDLPEVVASVRLWPESRGVRHGEVEAIETVVWADPNVFEVFPLPVFDGAIEGALTAPNSVVMTRTMARKYFGTDFAAGKMLEVDRTHLFAVTAVLEDLPTRSHLDLRILMSAKSAISPTLTPAALNARSIGQGPVLTYLRLQPGTLASVRAAAPGILDRHVEPVRIGVNDPVPPSDIVTYELQPLADIHMISQAGRAAQDQRGVLRPAGEMGTVRALLLTSVLILFVAITNFVNLMTAHAPRRATEIGVRKAMGARHIDLMVQFLAESFFYVSIALITALLCVYALLPGLSALVGREVLLTDKSFLLAAGTTVLLLVTSVLGGFYPAYVLSRFRPASTLKSKALPAMNTGLVREALVIAQFVVLIGLLIATIIIGRQTAFSTQNALRTGADQYVIAGSPCSENYRTRIAALPGVTGAACVTRSLFGGFGAARDIATRDEAVFRLHFVGADAGALELYGLAPVAGRFFRPGDEELRQRPGAPPVRRVVINKTTVRKLGFSSPEEVLGTDIGGQVGEGLDVIGVAPDFPIAVRSPRDPIDAIAFIPASTMMTGAIARMDPSLLLIKLDGARLGETLPEIDAAWESLGVEIPLTRKFVSQQIEEQFRDLARQTEAFNLFSAIAVFIACLGLFGLSAQHAESRTKEIGIRKTMAASSGDVLKLLLWQFTKPVLWANLIAWPAAYFIMRRWLEGFAYRIELAPWMFLGASAITVAIALATVVGHARLVSRTHPVMALRYE